MLRAPHKVMAVAVALVAVTPSVEAQGTQSDSAAILQAGRRFSAAYIRGDVAALSALYTSDAVIFPEGSDAIAGQEAINRYWTPRKGERHQAPAHPHPGGGRRQARLRLRDL